MPADREFQTTRQEPILAHVPAEAAEVEHAAAQVRAEDRPPEAVVEAGAEPTTEAEFQAEPVSEASEDASVERDERTASIPTAFPGGEIVPEVEVAETAAEVEALEAAQQQEVAEDVGNPAADVTAAIDPPVLPSRVAATTTKWVNMRAGPSDDAEIIEVVPALATVQAEAACGWCAVSYDGRNGYIYKTFLSYGVGTD